jgi:hypothetical protein
MPFAWKPVAGQVALIEMRAGGNECLTGVVIDGEAGPVVIDLGASPLPEHAECEVVASFFAPDALYRMTATLTPHDGARQEIIDLRVHDVERVQRRTAPRARLALPVVLSNFDDPSSEEPGAFASVIGETIDLGEGGCRVLMPKPFPSGCDPTVTLQLPSGETIVALAAVLQANATQDGRYEYRLVFLELEDVDRLRLAELIAEPQPA